MLELHAVKGPTARLLRDLLKQRGLMNGKVRGAVNYGYHGAMNGLPTLNENAGHQDKYQELVKLDKAGVQTVPFSRNALDLDTPIFGRKFNHTKGKDIFVYNVKPLLHGDHKSDFYTEVISKKREFRVWAFRNRHMATYEKILTYQHKLGLRGRNKAVWNWDNGYAFEFVHDPSKSLKQLGCAAVKALGLDFGAVDIIESQAGHLYVLEVNTAPGTQGAARQGITSLINNIETWAKAGFPGRD